MVPRWWICGGGYLVVDIWRWISAAMDIYGSGYLQRWAEWISAAVDFCSDGYLRQWISAAVGGGGYLRRWVYSAVDICGGRYSAMDMSLRVAGLPSNWRCAIWFAQGGCWTTAIKGGVCDIVCAGGCWTTPIKGGVHDIVCAGAVLDHCIQKGERTVQAATVTVNQQH